MLCHIYVHMCVWQVLLQVCALYSMYVLYAVCICILSMCSGCAVGAYVLCAYMLYVHPVHTSCVHKLCIHLLNVHMLYIYMLYSCVFHVGLLSRIVLNS